MIEFRAIDLVSFNLSSALLLAVTFPPTSCLSSQFTKSVAKFFSYHPSWPLIKRFQENLLLLAKQCFGHVTSQKSIYFCLGTVHILRNQFLGLFQSPSHFRNQCSNPPLGKILRNHWLKPHPSDLIIKDRFIMYHDRKYHVEIFFSSKTLFTCIALVIHWSFYLIITSNKIGRKFLCVFSII